MHISNIDAKQIEMCPVISATNSIQRGTAYLLGDLIFHRENDPRVALERQMIFQQQR